MGGQIWEGISYACLINQENAEYLDRSLSVKRNPHRGGIMTIQKQQHDLDQAADKEKGSNTKGPRRRRLLAQTFFMKSRLKSARETTKIKHYQDLIKESEDAPPEWVLKRAGAIPKNLILLFQAIYAQFAQIFRSGDASPKEIKKVREDPQNIKNREVVSIAKINPKIDSNRSMGKVEEAFKKVVGDIEGFEFLSSPPQGQKNNEHTVLVKVGVNWGHFFYPTVTSWESVYAVTKMCLEEAKNREATVKVFVGDESGIENGLWGGTTMKNFEHTKILHAAVHAGLERAASLEKDKRAGFEGAGELFKLVKEGYEITLEDTRSKEMRDMARKAGVEILAFGDEAEKFIQVQIPDKEKVKHFKDGILVPWVVAKDVTDIINLPKPPGRHLIMGNTGLTGAMKNHVGLLKASARSWMFHGGGDPLPDSEGKDGDSDESSLRPKAESESGIRRLVRKIVRFIDWAIHGPDMGFHEKIVEIYLAFKDKERFSATDMRRTVSSLGPDIGDTIDIGVVIASKDPVALDAVAGAFLKERYKQIGTWFDALKPGGDSFWEYLAGKTWLRNCTPFDLKSHIAANSYGIGPIDLDHIDFKGFESSGFRVREIDAIAEYLQPLANGVKIPA